MNSLTGYIDTPTVVFKELGDQKPRRMKRKQKRVHFSCVTDDRLCSPLDTWL